MPGYTSSVAVDSSLAVAETVIVGSVPDTYTYFNSVPWMMCGNM